MKTLYIPLFFACAVAQANSISFSSLLDPAPDAFCTDATHPICLKLTQVAFTGLTIQPTQMLVEDDNGFATVYTFHNLNVTVDPGGLTYSGSITPDEAFSITDAQNADLQQGLFRLEVLSNLVVGVAGFGGTGPSAVVANAQLPAETATPEPGTEALLLIGLVTGVLAHRRTKS